VHGEFQADSFNAECKGDLRFLFGNKAHPRFELYVSPINIVRLTRNYKFPRRKSYSRDVSEEAGEFYNQGIYEDTKALAAGVRSGWQYLEQGADQCWQEIGRFLTGGS